MLGNSDDKTRLFMIPVKHGCALGSVRDGSGKPAAHEMIIKVADLRTTKAHARTCSGQPDLGSAEGTPK